MRHFHAFGVYFFEYLCRRFCKRDYLLTHNSQVEGVKELKELGS